MPKSFEDVVLGKVVSAAITDSDVSKLAGKLRPQILAYLEKEVMAAIKNEDWCDTPQMDNLLGDIADAMVAEMRAKLGIVKKGKK